MATLTSVTVVGTGIASNETTVTAGTTTIAVTDLSRTFVRVQNHSSTASVAISFAAGADPMVAEGIGALSVTVGTELTYYIGASWDSSRLKSTSGTIVITQPTAANVTIDCGVLTPY